MEKITTKSRSVLMAGKSPCPELEREIVEKISTKYGKRKTKKFFSEKKKSPEKKILFSF